MSVFRPGHILAKRNPSILTTVNSTAAVSEDAAAVFSNSNPASPCGADDVTAAGLITAPIPGVLVAVTLNSDRSDKNSATSRALAASDTASADHSSISET